ncbi:MAG: class I SAM-dependent methyltransferase [Candidatus Marinimicrobia bacterium]|nr:class I SAM-dependent methyltransferase [Candidatus Neomarinimicrobiota bacterium]
MSDKNVLGLGNVQKTLLLPLWGRAIETRKKKPLLIDKMAASIIQSIPYYFTTIARNISKLSQASWIARSIYFDHKIKAFINQYPDATVINIGCGLDTTFDRIDNGKLTWFELDLPDVIELRKKYIPESDRRKFITASVFDPEWLKEIPDEKPLMFLFAGVLYYFTEENIKKLFTRFVNECPAVEILFDYSSSKGIEMANKMVIKRSGMDESAKLIWGIEDIYEMENWGIGIKVLDSIPMFQYHKKNYPFYKRVRMSFSDKLKIMSLAHIRIG